MDSFNMGVTMYQPNNMVYIEANTYNDLINSIKHLTETNKFLFDIIRKNDMLREGVGNG